MNLRTRVTVITKKGCHICEDTIEDLRKLSSKHGFELSTLDILEDKELFDKYWDRIPIVRVDGKDVFDCEDIAFPQTRVDKLESLFSQ